GGIGCQRISSLEPRPCVEALDFGVREIDGVPASFRRAGLFRIANRRAVGEQLFDVCRAAQIRIVQADQHAVFCYLQVLLDVIRSLFDRKLISRESMLRRITRCPAMCDEERLLLSWLWRLRSL